MVTNYYIKERQGASVAIHMHHGIDTRGMHKNTEAH